jgi:hypothetical protein
MGNTTEIIKMNGFKRNSNILLNSNAPLMQSNYRNCETISRPLNLFATTSASTSQSFSTSSRPESPPLWSGTLTTTASLTPLSSSPASPSSQTPKSKTKSDVLSQLSSPLRRLRLQRGRVSRTHRTRVPDLLLSQRQLQDLQHPPRNHQRRNRRLRQGNLPLDRQNHSGLAHQEGEGKPKN